MATFLELVNKIGPDSGTVSGTIGSIASASGRWLKVVGWTREAWELIQKSRSDWTFRTKQFSGSLSPGLMEYTAASFGITDFGGWPKIDFCADCFDPFTIYDPDRGRADEGALKMARYEDWVRSYDRGVPDQVRPNVVAIGPNRDLLFGPPPDKTYTVRGFYKRAVQSLSADADTPYIDAEFHDAIKWRALMLLAEFDEGEFPLVTAGDNFRQIHAQMLSEYLPQTELA